MIDSKFHIELDGEPYRLAVSAEGNHHNVRGEPLRPPNAVTIQGINTQKFQPRPEVLLWNWTDWVGGEGRRTLKPFEGDRAWELDAVRVFEEPGHLIPGYYTEITQGAGSSDLVKSLALVVGAGALYGLDRNADDVYLWDNATKKWLAGTTLVGPTVGSCPRPVGDQNAIYWAENSTREVWKWTGSGNATSISSGVVNSSTVMSVGQSADAVFVYRALSATVWEITKTGSSTIVIDTWTEPGRSSEDGTDITELDGRVYVMVSTRAWTAIREITPSSAAGVGFGAEIARIPGFWGESLWAHSGRLFIAGKYQDPTTERTVLYLTPQGDYGTLGELRHGHNLGSLTGGGTRMLDHFFVAANLSSTQLQHALFQVDATSGALACVSRDEVGDAAAEIINSLVTHEGSVFWSTDDAASAKRTMRADPTRYMSNSLAVSPEHDFDLVSEKFLSSLVLSCQPLPANWTIYVDYQVDGDGTWTNVITYTTTAGTGLTTAVTTDSATVEFKRIQLRVRFAYTGGGVPTSAPVVLGIEARAIVATKVKVFQYLLDLSDDRSAGKQSRSGASKVDTFLATAEKTTSVALKDGFTSRKNNVFDEYDVFLDEYNVSLDYPGEGIAAVTLREVI